MQITVFDPRTGRTVAVDLFTGGVIASGPKAAHQALIAASANPTARENATAPARAALSLA